ncbi:hypothetical protein ABG067_004626 [Albugo candida]|uniref:2-phosphoglycerate kinase n=1 Tax=Albugo candida TaxID=65357 RepID=A0A024FT56_9STRA|nr:unnamed protein product [Albugo candida]|eukprot:CCI10275.1 unnamed protein product [Albugo candida]
MLKPAVVTENIAKRNQSKYDFVKVRVWVEDHVYVLSRYLVCRALVSTKINAKDAVQISLDLKRTLVDLELRDIMQEEFEDFLYKTMIVFGYGEAHIARYRMMTTFHRTRVPLLIIMAGTACISKSTLATKLADRLNLSSVLQTDLIFELMCNFSGRSQTLYTDTKFPHSDAMLEEYTKDCEIVRKGVQSDIDKCLKEGKSLIIEGFHIDPRLYHQEIQTQAMDLINKAGCSGIVLPFLLTLDEKNHAEFLHNSPDPRYHSSNASDGFENLRNVQSYLIDQVNGLPSKSFTEIPVNLHSFHETLDIMHDIVLDKINEVYKMNNGNLI